MSDTIDMLNSPVAFKIGNKEYKAKRASLADLRASFEVEAKEEYIANAQKVAGSLPVKEKMEFLLTALKQIPCGEELDNIIQNKTSSFNGLVKILYSSLKDENKLSLEECKKIFAENMIECNMVIHYALGVELIEDKKEVPKDPKDPKEVKEADTKVQTGQM